MADIKTLSSYAIIEHLWNSNKDFIEVYALMSIPALIEAIKNGSNTIDAVRLKEFFSRHYGLNNITVGATTKFLDVLSKRHDAVRKKDHQYFIKSVGLHELNKQIEDSPDITNEINRIIENIQATARETHNQDLTYNEVLEGLLDFFDNYAGEMTIEQKEFDDVVRLRYKNKGRKQRIKYIISEYIKQLNDENNIDFDILLRFSIGHLVASAVTLRTMPNYDPSLKGLTIYIDAPLIFNLLGFSGDIPRRLALELVSILKERKARMILSTEHYSEVIGSINFAIGLLSSEHPDETKINKIYLYADENGLSASDLELKSQQVRSQCEANGIEILSTPTKESGYTTLSVDDIYNVIVEVFESNLQHPLPNYRKTSVKRDASVLKNVFSLRTQSSNNKLKDSGAILATNNKGLCVAVSDQRLSPDACVFPAAMLTENLSMIMWLESPVADTELQRLMIIDQCVKALQPKADTIRFFYNDIKIKHANNQISDADYRAALSAKVVRKVLSEITFNDNNLYTDETAIQVIARLRELEGIKASAAEKKLSRKESHLKKKSDLIAEVICIIIASLLAGLAIINLFFKPILPTCISYILAVLFCVWFALNWASFIPSKANVKKYLSEKIYAWLTPQD